MWKKKFYFENTNFLLKDADLILIIKKKKKVRFLFFLNANQIFFFFKQIRFLFGKNANQILY